MARKADLGEPRGDLSRRTTIHNPTSHTLRQRSPSEFHNEPSTRTPSPSPQLQQYINQNKVLARRNGILSSRVTELEDKVTSLNDEITRLRKNDTLKSALELVEKNLVNSFNVSMKQLQRIRVDNGMQHSTCGPVSASTSYRHDVAKKTEEVKPSMTREERTKIPVSKTNSIMTPPTPTINHEAIVKEQPGIPQFFKKADQFESTSKFSTILDESDSEDMFDIRQVGVFAKEPTVVIDEDSDEDDKSDIEKPCGRVEDNVPEDQKDKNVDDEDDFLAEFGRHESSFVGKVKESKEMDTQKSGAELRETKEKRLSSMPDMSDYEALLESLKLKGDSGQSEKGEHGVEAVGETVAEVKAGAPKTNTRTSRRGKTNVDNDKIHDDMPGNETAATTESRAVIDAEKSVESEPQEAPIEITGLHSEEGSNSKRSTRSGISASSHKSSLAPTAKQRRSKRFQIKQDSVADNDTLGEKSRNDETTPAIASKADMAEDAHLTPEHEIIDLDQSPQKKTDNKRSDSRKTTTNINSREKRKPLSNLTNSINKPTKKRKQTTRNENWDLDIFDLRNA
ncbi:hypothetical protein CANMA_003950 [Candida margitis]|uniref:uncharacterized protein n=1 Tax=Candida margitis TaxID=1775924 RepID=UPI002227FFF7|nr:uncharacterized protein CANMA_003950 [Candida margitis]KAI5960864.1 hypothetical protein CANMA_003950 [Candida margitis]